MSRLRRLKLALPAVAVFLAQVLLQAPAISPAQQSPPPPRCGNVDAVPTSANIVRVRAATLCLLNAERARAGLRPLRDQGQLRKAAQAYSRKMVRMRFFDHVCPLGSTLRSRVRGGTAYLDRARSWALGENLAWGSGRRASPRDIVESWMGSGGHRENILDPRFCDIGIGVAPGAPVGAPGMRAATYTTDFGSRRF